MAPTEGRFARPERRWGCRRGTPRDKQTLRIIMHCTLGRLQWTATGNTTTSGRLLPKLNLNSLQHDIESRTAAFHHSYNVPPSLLHKSNINFEILHVYFCVRLSASTTFCLHYQICRHVIVYEVFMNRLFVTLERFLK